MRYNFVSHRWESYSYAKQTQFLFKGFGKEDSEDGKMWLIDSKGKKLGLFYDLQFSQNYILANNRDGHFHLTYDSKPKPLYTKKFSEIRDFVQSFACAKDELGWFHINLKGEELYSKRFEEVTPFCESYGNFYSLATIDNSVNNHTSIIIDTNGNDIGIIFKQMYTFFTTEINEIKICLLCSDDFPSHCIVEGFLLNYKIFNNFTKEQMENFFKKLKSFGIKAFIRSYFLFHNYN